MRRAAASVPANIAKGAERNGNAELTYHLGVAAGELSELDSHVDLAARIGYIDVDEAIRIRTTVSLLRRAVFRFQGNLNSRPSSE
jgi:four helix bundle protein